MSELISGEKALKHVAECTVQYQHPDEPKGVWTTITNHFWDQYNLGIFLNKNTKFKFRLKPRTITINGVEVPAPFKPKDGEECWYLTDSNSGYSSTTHKDSFSYVFNAVWKSEDEIKQVDTALRSIFNVK